ncbi:hypothetical protein YC2023_011486 [Brassica napus]
MGLQIFHVEEDNRSDHVYMEATGDRLKDLVRAMLQPVIILVRTIGSQSLNAYQVFALNFAEMTKKRRVSKKSFTCNPFEHAFERMR